MGRSAHCAISVMSSFGISLRNMTRRYNYTKFTFRIVLSEMAYGVFLDLIWAVRIVVMIDGSEWQAVVGSHQLLDVSVPAIS